MFEIRGIISGLISKSLMKMSDKLVTRERKWRMLDDSVFLGKMIISLSLNITMNRLGGASVIAIFTTRRSHGYVNTTTWLGISQFFLFLAPNFNILTTENRSRCNRDLN